MIKNKILGLIILILVVVFSWFYYQIYFPQESFCQEEIVFIIPRGESFSEIGNNLEKKGIIENSFYFKIYAVLSGTFRQFQAGNYVFCSNDSIKKITETMRRGDVTQERITVIEGWNIKDIGEYFEKLNIIGKKDFLKKANSSEFNHLFSFLEEKPKESGLEGYLFPDTYFVPYGVDVDLIIELMLNNFNNKVKSDLKNEIKEQEKSFFEIIKLASLIEKEVREYEDKRLVSGIIQKRLEIGMPLQIDATISYITGKRTVAVSIAETRIDSPYNTYKYKGLPIAPICNPGVESIKAALFPKESDYLYYLSKPNGETVFSRTHQEHVAAKNKYLRQ